MGEKIYYNDNWSDIGGTAPFDYTNKIWLEFEGVLSGMVDASQRYRFSLYSTDGLNWTTWLPQTSGGRYGKLYSNSTAWSNAILVGGKGYVTRSSAVTSDGCWVLTPEQIVQKLYTPVDTSNYMDMAVYATNGTLLVAVGSMGGSSFYILTSPDGEIWTSRYTNSSVTSNSVVYAAGGFYAAYGNTGIIASSNGTSWGFASGSRTSGSYLRTHNGCLFETSSSLIRKASSFSPSSVTFGTVDSSSGVVYSMVGDGVNTIVAVRSGSVLTSTDDGDTWTQTLTNTSLHRVTYIDGKFILIRDATSSSYYYSSDGSTWNTTGWPGGISIRPKTLYRFDWNN